MTLIEVIHWLTEYAVKYRMDKVIEVLRESFPCIVPNLLSTPLQKYLTAYMITNKMIEMGRKTKEEIMEDKILHTCEFWRRFRSLVVNMAADLKLDSHLGSFEVFIGNINALEYSAFMKTRDLFEVNAKIEEMLSNSCEIRYGEVIKDVDYLKRLSVLIIRKELEDSIALKIIKVLQDNFIVILKMLIIKNIIKKESCTLDCLITGTDFVHDSDPFVIRLKNSMLKMEVAKRKIKVLTHEQLQEIIYDILEEQEIANIPTNPIVVYLSDKVIKLKESFE